MPEPSHPAGVALQSTGTVPRRMILLVGTAITLVLAFAFWHRPHAPPPSSPGPPATTLRASAEATPSLYVTVHVTGAVAHPGLVAIPEGGRVADALAAAGGVRPGGDLGAINLAAALVDGTHIVVPWIADPLPTGRDDASVRSPDHSVDLNTAGVDRLTDLPGVGPVLANRILTYRETHGPFEVLEDLLDVPGIGEGRLADLRDHAVVRP